MHLSTPNLAEIHDSIGTLWHWQPPLTLISSTNDNAPRQGAADLYS